MKIYRNGYCSWCFQQAEHVLKEVKNTSRNLYRCRFCGRLTVTCSVPRCSNMCRTGQFLHDMFCAEHSGLIPGFHQMGIRLEHIEKYESLTKRNTMNVKRTAAMSIAVAGTLLSLYPVLLPIRGATIALASESFTLPLFRALSLASNSIKAGSALNELVSEVKEFKIRKIRDGEDPQILILNGFLTERKTKYDSEWVRTIGSIYPDNAIYIVDWESKRLLDLGKVLVSETGKRTIHHMVKKSISRSGKMGFTGLTSANYAVSALEIFTNSWQMAKLKAKKAGLILGDIISRTPDEHSYVLVGHSLGSKVIHSLLERLNEMGKKKIDTIHLLGSALPIDPVPSWEDLLESVRGNIYNYYAPSDPVLKWLYSAANGFVRSNPSGRSEIPSQSPRIVNINVDDFVRRHMDYHRKAGLFLVRE